MNLLVIRHALAMDKEDFQQLAPDPSHADDRLRPLTSQGFKKMHKGVLGLKKVFDGVEVLLSSPLVRAVQTAEIVIDAYGIESFLQTETLTPGADLDDFFAYAQTLRQSNLTLVGHEPHLSGLIAYALTGKPGSIGELRKGGACLIEFPHGLKPGEGHLQWWLTSRQLRRLA
jgi:phosphohistidine phosphatase